MTQVPASAADPFWPIVHGEARVPLPAMPEFVEILRARGRRPDIVSVTTDGRRLESRAALEGFARRQLWIEPEGPEGGATPGRPRRARRGRPRWLDDPRSRPERHRDHHVGAALTRPGDGSGADAPSVADLVRIERALGWRPTRCRPAAADRGEGGTAARWIVAEGASASGRVGSRSAFVKIGATSLTAEWTRVEHANYRSLRGWFLPEVLGFDDDGARPVLALEDLSGADWPPPWTDARVTAVLAALDAVHRTTPPGHLIERPEDQRADWEAVAADPGPFLRLGLCSRDWLETALPTLTRAAGDAPLGGNALIHLDIRSDNLCFRSGRAVILDWNHAQLGNPDWDVAFWLPSLHDEGGPPPESILPDAPGLAAWVAGYFCARAGEPPIPEAPHVRPLQVRQSRTSLAWVARALGLAEP